MGSWGDVEDVDWSVGYLDNGFLEESGWIIGRFLCCFRRFYFCCLDDLYALLTYYNYLIL